MSNLTLESMLQRSQEASVLFSVSIGPPVFMTVPQCSSLSMSSLSCFSPAFNFSVQETETFMQTNLRDEVTTVPWRLCKFWLYIHNISHYIWHGYSTVFFLFCEVSMNLMIRTFLSLQTLYLTWTWFPTTCPVDLTLRPLSSFFFFPQNQNPQNLLDLSLALCCAWCKPQWIGTPRALIIKGILRHYERNPTNTHIEALQPNASSLFLVILSCWWSSHQHEAKLPSPSVTPYITDGEAL